MPCETHVSDMTQTMPLTVNERDVRHQRGGECLEKEREASVEAGKVATETAEERKEASEERDDGEEERDQVEGEHESGEVEELVRAGI